MITRAWWDSAQWFRSLGTATKTIIIVLTDLVALSVVVLLAYMLRVSSIELPPMEKLHIYLIAPLISVALAAAFKCYRAISRNYSFHEETRILVSQLLVPPLWSLILLVVGTEGFARSVVIIYFALSLITLVLIRRAAVWYFSVDAQTRAARRKRVPILIYGAAQEGVQLSANLLSSSKFSPVALLDSDTTLIGRRASGLKVYPMSSLKDLVEAHEVQEVMIAKRGLSRSEVRKLVNQFGHLGLKVKTVPTIAEVTADSLAQLKARPVRLEDLLGRDPVPPNADLMNKAIKGRVVMVTGAGGSIGSELVRQIALFNPSKIIMFENNEFSLFSIHREMEQQLAKNTEAPQIIPVLGDILDFAKVQNVMAEHTVDVVFHAAAYKHVRMVQENASAGIANNVWGTFSVAEAACRQNVSLFVMISTDKAVRPTSVMGASKRVAEMVIQAIANRQGPKPIFAMVRFGNVLGSTGSVVPIFQQQIANGGPVVVTHPDVIRYFMLIPEAAQLVIQAAAMAEGGEVFVLEMGEPIKILQLAETMIDLAGLVARNDENPDGDIEIRFSGLHEGEKLYEELQIGHDISNTEHPLIMKSKEFFLPYPELMEHLLKIKDAEESSQTVDQALSAILGDQYTPARRVSGSNLNGFADEAGTGFDYEIEVISPNTPSQSAELGMVDSVMKLAWLDGGTSKAA